MKPPLRVYISGPMSGIPEFNYPAFRTAAETLRAQGFVVVNPAELSEPTTACKCQDWQQYMRKDIRYLMDCEAVFVLPNWEQSRGAKIEVGLANSLDMPIFDDHGHLAPEYVKEVCNR